jgi:hypothetical protein
VYAALVKLDDASGITPARLADHLRTRYGQPRAERAQVGDKLRRLVDVEVAADQDESERQPLERVLVAVKPTAIRVDRLERPEDSRRRPATSSADACSVTIAR